MDEKYFERQVELFCNEDSDESILDFAKRIYLDGCKAQAEADRIAINDVDHCVAANGIEYCYSDSVKNALAAAEIKEVK